MPKLCTLRFFRSRSSNDWRWTLIASNGRKVANSGEGYRRHIDCQRIAALLFPWIDPATGKGEPPARLAARQDEE